MSPRGVWAVVGAVVLLASASRPALAHSGHTDRAPWDACSGRSLGERCAWDDAAHDLHVGTCRSVAQSLVCVRNKPVISAAQTQASPRGEGPKSPRGAGSAALALLVGSAVGAIALGRWRGGQRGAPGAESRRP